jgi:hypothetical protein
MCYTELDNILAESNKLSKDIEAWWEKSKAAILKEKNNLLKEKARN